MVDALICGLAEVDLYGGGLLPPLASLTETQKISKPLFKEHPSRRNKVDAGVDPTGAWSYGRVIPEGEALHGRSPTRHPCHGVVSGRGTAVCSLPLRDAVP